MPPRRGFGAALGSRGPVIVQSAAWPGIDPSGGHKGAFGADRGPRTADRAALLHEHMVRTGRALQANAADYAALLEQRADLTRPGGRADYPAEIKRWRAFADQAEQMARRWEQSPLP